MKNLIYPVSLLFLLVSCTQIMDVELDNSAKRLVVEGSVTSDFKKHFVKLTQSSDVFYNQEPLPVKNAAITIDDGETTYSMEETSEGLYQTIEAFAGEPGKTYHLSISDVDIDIDGNYEEYSASSYMPMAHIVDSIGLTYNDNYYDEEVWGVSIYLQDSEEREDYYGFASCINDKLVHDTISEVIVVEDKIFNGNRFNGVIVSLFHQDNPDEILQENDEITLETYSINEEYFRYIKELQTMAAYQNPLFSGPPANIMSNISNGAMGFFSAYSITRTKTIFVNKNK